MVYMRESKIIHNLESSVKPPSAVDVEQAILGSVLIDRDAILKAVELLTPEQFYLKEHRLIFEGMCKLFNSGKPIDTLTVYEELKRSGNIEEVGGAGYLSKLSQNISSAANIEHYCKIILEKYILRSLITSSMEIAKSSYEAKEDAFEILEKATTEIFNLSKNIYSKKSFTALEVINRKTIELFEAIKSKGENNFLVRTGFIDLDNILGGLKNSDLIILAARPSQGKTSMALNIVKNVSRIKPVGFSSLEMSETQLSARLISQECGIPVNDLLSGNFNASQAGDILAASNKINNLPIFIDDTPGISIMEFRSKAKRLKMEKNIGLLVVDYLQLMHAQAESREREISTISQTLKAIAKELDIPIIALSQLNRACEARSDKRPMLADLRESGSLEQDSDVVLFIYRPEYYGISKTETGEETKNLAKIIVGKQRNGAVGEVNLTFIKEQTRFENHIKFTGAYDYNGID